MNPQNQKPREKLHSIPTYPYMRNFLTIFLEYLALLSSTKSPGGENKISQWPGLFTSVLQKERKKERNKHTHDSGTQLIVLGPGKEREQRKQSCRKHGTTLQDILQPYNFITNYKNITIPCNSSKACFLCSSFPYWMKHWIRRVESCAKAICRQTVGTF